MKKFILLALLFFPFVCSVSANEKAFENSYSFQEAYENGEKQRLLEGCEYSALFDSNYLTKDDYDGYLNGKGSGYRLFLEELENIKNKSSQNAELNISYYNQILSNIESGANGGNTNLIHIINEDYEKLYDSTKRAIFLNNFFSLQDRSELNSYVFEGCNIQMQKWKEDTEKYKSSPQKLKEISNEIWKAKDLVEKYKTAHKASSYLNSEAYFTAEDLANEFKKLDQNVFANGYEYEKKKYFDWAVRNNKKTVRGRLYSFVYTGYHPVAPQVGQLYKHVPSGDFFLKVMQSVPGGVLITGDPRMGTYNYETIFLQTTKNFVDGQPITDFIMAEFVGYFEYSTVLGARRKIYKFRSVSEKEIKNNFEIPGQPFYFYSPY